MAGSTCMIWMSAMISIVIRPIEGFPNSMNRVTDQIGRSHHNVRTSIWEVSGEDDRDGDNGRDWQMKEGMMDRRSAFLRSSSVFATAVSFMTVAPPSSYADSSSSSSPSSPSSSSTESRPSNTHISAQWKAIDGLRTSSSTENRFVSFDSSAYSAMKNDSSRTPLFEAAILHRLRNAPDDKLPEDHTVLDLGTGPFALFAVTAANAGAGKVYAIEADPLAAQSARSTVRSLGLDSVITVLEGLSTEVTLPTPADFCIAEIVGSVATEEGAYATILDTHERHLRQPNLDENWIPSRIQTYAAPASYTLHNLFQPPAFDWNKLQGEPVRFNCRDEGLQLLSDPLLIEDVRFKDIQRRNKPDTSSSSSSSSSSSTHTPISPKTLTFTVDPQRLSTNTDKVRDELKRGGLRKLELETKTNETAQSFSGIALWPRLFLDGDNGKIRIDTRTYPDGGHQKSHWQTVLPIMSDVPVKVQGGDQIVVDVDFKVPEDVLTVASYRLEGNVVHKS